MTKNVAIIIPARYKSSRFPGKPLVNILGKTMIKHVWEVCSKAINHKNVYVATDDSRIYNHCLSENMNVIMTSQKCLTGTDRVYEASRKIKANYYLNIQGDEPLININDIKKMIKSLKYVNDKTLINAQCAITKEEDYQNVNIPKCVSDLNNYLLFMSRAQIPSNKLQKFRQAKKQVCIYGFKKNQLKEFYNYGMKTPLEKIEDIEILRFLEMGYKVKMIDVSSSSIAVDIPRDVNQVIKILKQTG